MLAPPAEVNLAIGHSAAHIMTIIRVPLTAAARSPIPRISATPMPSRPSMKVQSAQAAPAQAWKVDSKGPTATLLRKPLVGEPPWIQALAAGVAYPSPKVLSRNAHRNSKPTTTRMMARNLVARAVMIAPNAGSVVVDRSAMGGEPSRRSVSRMAMTCLLQYSLEAVSRGCPAATWAERPPAHGPVRGAGPPSAGLGLDLAGGAREHGDVVGPLPSGRVADRALAAQAAQVADRLHPAPLQPLLEAGLDRPQVLGPVAQQGRGHHGHVRPGH